MSNQIYPTGELAPNLGADTPTYDPSKLKNLVSGLSNKSVELEYDTQDPTNQRVADLVQAELQNDGPESAASAASRSRRCSPCRPSRTRRPTS